MKSPDNNATGFLENALSALRYEFQSLDPDDSGMKLANLVTPNSRVLDVGCGTGVITNTIRNVASAIIVGIEPDSERVNSARARGLEVHEGVLTQEFIESQESFDFVVFADVLEHLSDPAEIVALAKTALKPGGAIIASIPNVAHWFVRTDLLFGRFDYQDCGIMDATHLRWFTQKTAVNLFERLGFQVGSLDFTVNINLPDYKRRLPWRWLSPSLRRKVVGQLAAIRPSLFGCQHIIMAKLPEV